MTEKKTTAKRKRPPAKPKAEVVKEEPKASIIHIPISPEDSLTLAKDVEDQYKLIAMPTPKKFIKEREGRGGYKFEYVEANYVISRLNATFLYDWDFEVLEYIIKEDQKMIALLGKLTVRFKNGREISKTAWGGSDIKYLTKYDEQSRRKVPTNRMVDFSSDLKSAESDCIKKAASMVGLCWDIFAGYGQQEIVEPVIEQEKVEEKPVEPPQEPEHKPKVIEAEIVDEAKADEPEPPIEQQQEPSTRTPIEPEPISKEEGKEIVASEEREGIKDYVQKQLTAIYGKTGMETAYKSMKLFLYEWQDTKIDDDTGNPRKFVDMNQWNNISLLLGNLEDLRLLKLHWKYILAEWKKWADATTRIPF